MVRPVMMRKTMSTTWASVMTVWGRGCRRGGGGEGRGGVRRDAHHLGQRDD